MIMAFPPEQSNKDALRTYWKGVRRSISEKRKKEASIKAFKSLAEMAKDHKYVLSYASFANEFYTEEINIELQARGKLLLPMVDGENLRIFLIGDLKRQLKNHPKGFGEPISSLCQEMDISIVSLILVPGIAFDADHYRLGYGKGYYDRFLSKFSSSTKTYGLGFKEQYSATPLPRIPTDHPLHGLLLF